MPTRIGLTRRLQALRALGWTTSEVARITGLYRATIRRVTNDERCTVTAPTARAIIWGYARASHRTPPATTERACAAVDQVRRHAIGRGWAPPMAWDDIDDPRETPTGIRRTGSSEIAGVDEAILLLQLGVAPDEVARRLGVQRSSLGRRLRRAQEHKWAALVERKHP